MSNDARTSTADIAGREPARLGADMPGSEMPETPATPAVAADAADRRSELLDDADGEQFRGRWTDVQTRFVDAPRDAVQAADELVADLMQRLAHTFAQERDGLESQWRRGEDVSTEDLRLALQRYRSFFDRLLAA